LIVGFVYDKTSGEIQEWIVTSHSAALDNAPISEEEVRAVMDKDREQTSGIALIEMDDLDWKYLSGHTRYGHRINPETGQYEPREGPRDDQLPGRERTE